MVVLLVIIALIVYLCMERDIPNFLDKTPIAKLLWWKPRYIELVKNVALSTIASGIFYYFIVHIPEQKKVLALDVIVQEKINTIYHSSIGVPWALEDGRREVVGYSHPEMSVDHIRERVRSTSTTQPEYADIPNKIYRSWSMAKTEARNLSGIIIQNTALTDHGLLSYLSQIENTSFNLPAEYKSHPQRLLIIENGIIDLYEKAEALREYYVSKGGEIEEVD
ncbi:MAG: hypothetical protein ACRBCK_02730 [Alphaproteobacteria bacterium]